MDHQDMMWIHMKLFFIRIEENKEKLLIEMENICVLTIIVIVMKCLIF